MRAGGREGVANKMAGGGNGAKSVVGPRQGLYNAGCQKSERAAGAPEWPSAGGRPHQLQVGQADCSILFGSICIARITRGFPC